jgi:C1A family cysteine protease
MPALRDQGNKGSCTGHGVSACMNILALNGKIQLPLIGRDALPFSPLFIYYNERVMEGSVNQDAGAEIRDGIKSIAKLGCCTEKVWSYDDGPTKFKRKPSGKAYKDALHYQAIKYSRIDSPENASANQRKQAINDALAAGYPIVFGMTVYNGFESQETQETGVVPMPNLKSDDVLGGHCMAIVGQKVDEKQYIVLNSWGADYGDGGYLYIPMDYLTDADLAGDFWVIQEIE